MEDYDERCALEQTKGENLPVNDGHNACAFLTIAIGDKLISMDSLEEEDDDDCWRKVKDVTESAILDVPARINMSRDKSKLYDIF